MCQVLPCPLGPCSLPEAPPGFPSCHPLAVPPGTGSSPGLALRLAEYPIPNIFFSLLSTQLNIHLFHIGSAQLEVKEKRVLGENQRNSVKCVNDLEEELANPNSSQLVKMRKKRGFLSREVSLAKCSLWGFQTIHAHCHCGLWSFLN